MQTLTTPRKQAGLQFIANSITSVALTTGPTRATPTKSIDTYTATLAPAFISTLIGASRVDRGLTAFCCASVPWAPAYDTEFAKDGWACLRTT
jgi:hypothetical protein